MPKAEQTMPEARKDQLLVKELANETLVYDESNNKAHCLNQTAALVWKNCDGRTSVAKLAQRLGRETDGEVSEPVVWLAIDQLKKSCLLESAFTIPEPMARMSRREVTRALGIAAAVTVPLITSIIAPRAAAAATGAPCRTLGQSCNGPNGTLSNCCNGEECCALGNTFVCTQPGNC